MTISPNLLLIDAAEQGDLETVINALQAGADVNFKDDDYQTAIMLAAIGNHIDTVEYLIRMGATTSASSPKTWDYINAVIFKNLDNVALLLLGKIQEDLERNPIPDAETSLCLRMPNGISRIPIHQAVKNGNLDILKTLLDITKKTQGESELRDAFVSFLETDFIDHGITNPEIIKCFLNAGADINLPDIFGNLPLFYAKSIIEAKVFFDFGVDMEHRNKDGLTAAEYQDIQNKRTDIAEYIEKELGKKKKDELIRSAETIETYDMSRWL